MLTGKNEFAQLIEFLPQKTFQRIVMKYQGETICLKMDMLNYTLIFSGH
jgi:hypothetical protein